MANKLGILAGGGELPGRIIEACKTRGRDFYVIAIEGQADAAVIGDNPHTWIRLGAAQMALEVARREDFNEIVMVGPVNRPSIAALRPDLLAAKVLARAGASSVMGDDGLLKAVIAQIEEFGFNVIGPDTFLKEGPDRAGVLGKYSPDIPARTDIERGIHILNTLGPVDVGQAVIVQDNIVIAVEAVEGTDAMIDRSGDLRRDGPGGVLIKLPKPGQEKRADMPTVGPRTIERMHAAGLRGVAFEASNTLLIDRDATIALADQHGLFVLALDLREWAPEPH
ncbi:MAG: LpxI family protein [Alphaproteobacteria bacterium]